MNNGWSTPQYLFDEYDEQFHFELDVCADEWNAKCKKYYTIDDDGLNKPWCSSNWMNPPFGRETGKWVKKAHLEAQLGKVTVGLLPAYTETNWFHDYCLKHYRRFIRGRVHFTDINGKSGRPRFGNVIVIFRRKL